MKQFLLIVCLVLGTMTYAENCTGQIFSWSYKDSSTGWRWAPNQPCGGTIDILLDKGEAFLVTIKFNGETLSYVVNNQYTNRDGDIILQCEDWYKPAMKIVIRLHTEQGVTQMYLEDSTGCICLNVHLY